MRQHVPIKSDRWADEHISTSKLCAITTLWHLMKLTENECTPKPIKRAENVSIFGVATTLRMHSFIFQMLTYGSFSILFASFLIFFGGVKTKNEKKNIFGSEWQSSSNKCICLLDVCVVCLPVCYSFCVFTLKFFRIMCTQTFAVAAVVYFVSSIPFHSISFA